MNDFGLTHIIGVITIFIASLLALFLLTLKTKNRLSNRLFAVFLLLIAMDIGGWVIPLFTDTPSNFTLFRSYLIFLQLPIFYLHVLAVCYSDFKLKAKHVVHALPFVIINLILIPRFYTVDLTSKMAFLNNGMAMWETKFFYVLIHLQIACYLIAIFMLLKKVRKLYLENYANADMRFHKWLFQITCFLTLFHSIAIFKNAFKFADYANLSEWMKVSLGVLELGILCWYLFKALKHPELFRSVDSKLQLVHTMILGSTISSDTTNSQEDTEKIKNLKDHMIKEEPFLESSLTAKDLADSLHMPVRDLSILINHTLGQHFFDFINEYRITKAKEILADPSKNKFTVLEILYEVGFNSKSSFNTAFKKHTGLTPTAFRKQSDNQ